MITAWLIKVLISHGKKTEITGWTISVYISWNNLLCVIAGWLIRMLISRYSLANQFIHLPGKKLKLQVGQSWNNLLCVYRLANQSVDLEVLEKLQVGESVMKKYRI